MNPSDLSEKDFIALARQYQKELLAPYGGWHYMPMGDARALMVPVSRGCTYDACVFCALNKYPFAEFTLEQVRENLSKLAFIHSRDRKALQRAVLLQGNPLSLRTEKLLQISQLIQEYFPDIREISGFARADDVLAKSPSELKRLRQAGYTHMTLGVESGSDRVLTFQNKGVSRDEQISAMRRLEQADIAYDCYVMLGLGGRELSREHISETASLINTLSPRMLIVVTTVLFRDAKLLKFVKAGKFTRLSPQESMEEMYQLLEGLDGPLLFNATHKTNLFAIKGQLPSQKEQLLTKLRQLLDQHELKGQGIRESQRWQRFGTE